MDLSLINDQPQRSERKMERGTEQSYPNLK